MFRKSFMVLAGVFLTAAAPVQSQGEFQRSYERSGCRIIALSIEHTALLYLSGKTPIRDILPRTRKMLDDGRADEALKQIAMRKSGEILQQLPPIRPNIKTVAQAQMTSRRISNEILSRCLANIAR